MEGSEFVKTVEAELKRRGIKKAAFYEATGISSATFSQWRNNIYSPSSYNIKQVGAFLDISFELVQKEKSPTPEGVERIPGYSDLNSANQAIIDNLIAQLLAAQSDD